MSLIGDVETLVVTGADCSHEGGNVESEDGPSAEDKEDGCLCQQQEWCGVPLSRGCAIGQRSDLPLGVSHPIEVVGNPR
jgi:hypothetical protein